MHEPRPPPRARAPHTHARTFGLEHGVHGLGLVRGHDLVLVALQQQHGAAEGVGVGDGAPLPEDGLVLGPAAHQAVQVAALELVGVFSQGLFRINRFLQYEFLLLFRSSKV